MASYGDASLSFLGLSFKTITLEQWLPTTGNNKINHILDKLTVLALITFICTKVFFAQNIILFFKKGEKKKKKKEKTSD